MEQNNIYDLYSSSQNKVIFDKALSFQTGSGSVRMNGIKNYIGYSPIPGTNWKLLVYAPQWEFMSSTFFSILLCCLISAIALTAAAVIVPVSNKISSSPASVTGHLQALAKGNLCEEVVLSHNDDETDLLTAAPSKTIAGLNHYVQNIRFCLGALSSGDYTVDIPDNFDGDFSSIHDSLCNITDSLNQTMLQMNRSSLEISQNSGEVSGYAKQLLDGSLNQSDLLAQLEESMQAITDSINRNLENVHQIEQYSENANQKTADETANAFREIRNVSEHYLAISQKLTADASEQETAVSYVTSQLASLKDIADSNRTLA